MVSQEERLREELRAIEEVLAVKNNMSETNDWSNFNQLQLDQCVPPEYQYLDEMDKAGLERRKQRLEEDLDDLKTLNEPTRFDDAIGYHKGRRIGEEDDG
jgi:hypothetical protein